ncbi:MAG: hypothetical protein WBG94_08400 [Anaerolineales bacterium]
MIDRSVMQKSVLYPKWWKIGLVGAVFAALALKIGVLAVQAVPFNADEAIVALMARHILQGERPLFFYGQAYMGSMDAFLVAAMFKLIGYQIWGIRLVQIALYTFTLLTTGWLGRELTGKWQIGVIAAWLLAIPTVSMTLYTTVSMGGYGEMLLLGNLILLITISITRDIQRKNSKGITLKLFALGFIIGFGLWVFGLTLIYSIPSIIYLAWYSMRSKSQSWLSNEESPRLPGEDGVSQPANTGLSNQISSWGVLLAGIFIGAFPWLAYGYQKGFSELLIELGGGAISGVESLSMAAQIAQHILNLGLFGTTVILGLRPSWEIRWLGLPLAPLVLSFWMGAFIFAIRKTFRDLKVNFHSGGYSHSPLLSGVIILLVIGFILTPFGADPSGRYFLPIAVVMALFAAQAIWEWQNKWRGYVFTALGLVLVFNLWGTIQTVMKTPPGVTTQFDAVTQIDHKYDQELIEFLRAQGEVRGYTNYWVAYPLAFLSAEDLVFIPVLPYHQDLRYTSRDDRYEPYRQEVEGADQTAYITTKNPLLDEQLRSGFKILGVKWKEKLIGDYQVYYQLSEKVDPDQIDLDGGEG